LIKFNKIKNKEESFLIENETMQANNSEINASSVNNIEKNIAEIIFEITSIHEPDFKVGNVFNESHASTPIIKNFTDERPSHLQAPIFRTSSANSLLAGAKLVEPNPNKSLATSIRDLHLDKSRESKLLNAQNSRCCCMFFVV
jgi:hypothetical protein